MLKRKFITIFILLFFCCRYIMAFDSNEFIDFIEQKNVQQVQKCLDEGISPNTCDKIGHPALLIAINIGSKEIAS